MTEVYLITGFLGAGKTCFVKNMVKALPHETMDIIVNEFGREGIDGALLHKTGLQVKEIVNGSIFCTCRLDQFEEALASSLSRKAALCRGLVSGGCPEFPQGISDRGGGEKAAGGKRRFYCE